MLYHLNVYVVICFFLERFCPSYNFENCLFQTASYSLSSIAEVTCNVGYCTDVNGFVQRTTCSATGVECQVAWTDTLPCQG